jgi:flagellar biosynthesis/type III secretory pathway chaperone
MQASTPAGDTGEEQLRHTESCIEQCMALTEVLHSALLEERSALERRDGEALERSLTAKRECIRQLEQADPHERLTGAILGRGEEPSTEDVLSYLASIGDDGTLARRWRTLLSATRECRDLNTINGRLAGALRDRAEQTLMLLRGLADGPGTYGPDGSVSRSCLDR